MALHKFRLYFTKRKNNIIFFVAALSVFTTLFVGMYLLVSTQAQSTEIRKTQDQNRQLLKGLSCILLILPEERNQQKIEDCIRINTDEEAINYEFFFKALEQNESISKESPDFFALLKRELTGLRGYPGSDGQDGADGEDGRDGKNSTSLRTVIKKEVPLKGEQGDPGTPGREVEFRHHNSRIEWRYVGEDIWTVLVKDCELLGNC